MAERAVIPSLVAGAEAEEVLLGGCEGGDSNKRDLIEMRLCMLRALGVNDPACEKRLRRKAKGLVRRHYRTIERVATALAECGVLTGHDIDFETE